MKTVTGIWRCDCATNNSELRMRCRYCNALRPIPVGVFYNSEAQNFYDVGAQGMGEDFYVFWRGRAAEFPRATPDAAADGFNAYGSGPVTIEAREPLEPDVLDMRGIGSGDTLIDLLASIDIDRIALECARKIVRLTAVDTAQTIAKIQLEVRAAIARRAAPLDFDDAAVVRAMAHVPGCDHDDMVSALEAALNLPSSKVAS
ncbi:hypothetical protein MPL3356_60533 [Mesorhizobium plurifarium]|uniref:RanBP2-type domain-containing protein n=1 Tax=Mesorhizobium plurifarium TaxID=69974 RepID=A0A090EF58_MESPL|nr:hypothetical protein MPL3356_60533 [Mesorhizobium plurifarium]